MASNRSDHWASRWLGENALDRRLTQRHLRQVTQLYVTLDRQFVENAQVQAVFHPVVDALPGVLPINQDL
jgi:hypothetical protein